MINIHFRQPAFRGEGLDDGQLLGGKVGTRRHAGREAGDPVTHHKICLVDSLLTEVEVNCTSELIRVLMF